MRSLAVFFDLFDTLIFCDEEIYQKSHDSLPVALRMDPAAFHSAWDSTRNDALEGVFPSLIDRCRSVLVKTGYSDDISLKCLYQLEVKALKKSIKPIPGVKDLLKSLVESGIRLGLISNASCSGPEIMKNTGLELFFMEIIFSFAEKVSKPDPLIYQIAADRIGVKTSQSLYIADGSGNELEGARRAGMRPVRFDPLRLHCLETMPPGVMDCSDVSELKKLILG